MTNNNRLKISFLMQYIGLAIFLQKSIWYAFQVRNSYYHMDFSRKKTISGPFDWLSLSWAILIFTWLATQHHPPPSTHPIHPDTTSLSWTETLFWAVLILDLSECDQNFRKDPSKGPDHIQINIRITHSSQEPPAYFKVPNQDMGPSKTSDHNQIKIKIPNPSQEPPASSYPQIST